MDNRIYDNVAIDVFAMVMKNKMKLKRQQGKSGWETDFCSNEFLSEMLVEHVKKGDPVDVAIIAMMLHHRGEKILS